jgi:hypothetical protein
MPAESRILDLRRTQTAARPDASSLEPASEMSHRLPIGWATNTYPIASSPNTPLQPYRNAYSQPVCVLEDTSSSLSLCLYALLGLGLCSSPRWIKKVSLGVIPHWYHDGGPSQIGHSLAICPYRLYPEPAYCFLDPAFEQHEPTPQCHRGLIEPLLRKAVFTRSVLASRAPPNLMNG